MAKKAKTEGLEWLSYSLAAFNGSGYANMSSPEDFLDSYIAYKSMYNKSEAVNLANEYRKEALPMLEKLLAKTNGAQRKPAQKYLDKFERYHSGIGEQQKLI